MAGGLVDHNLALAVFLNKQKAPLTLDDGRYRNVRRKCLVQLWVGGL